MDPSARIERIAARVRGRERDPLRVIAADAAAKGGRLRGPLEVTVEVTRDCAGGCVFCVQAARRDRQRMAVDRFADLVRALAAAGVARLRLTGGEPSAHPRLAELVALAKEVDLSLVIETDGSGWSAETLAAVGRRLDRRRDRLQISVDALSPATHRRLRSTPPAGPWALLEAGARAGLVRDSHTVVLAPNLDEIAGLVERLVAGGVARATVTLPHGRDLDPALRPDPAATLELFAALSERPQVRLSVAPLARALAEAGLVSAALARRFAGPCDAGRSACFIDVDARLSLCAEAAEAASTREPPPPFAIAWSRLAAAVASLTAEAARCPARADGLITLGRGAA